MAEITKRGIIMPNQTIIHEPTYESEEDYAEYNDIVTLPPPEQVAKVSKFFNSDGTETKLLTARKSAFIERIIYLDGKPFDFDGRHYLRAIYDTKFKHLLLKCGRQVEKCIASKVIFFMHDGSHKTTTDLKIGDLVSSFDITTGKAVRGRVTFVGENGVKPIFKVTTRMKRQTFVTQNHPFLKLFGWVSCEELSVGDLIATPQACGGFGETHDPNRARILGYLIGDGYFGRSPFGLTQTPGPLAEDFCQIIQTWDKINNIRVDSRSGSLRIDLPTNGSTRQYITELGLNNKKSAEKFIPLPCFDYDEESTRQLLRGLWGTDGHCKNVTRSKIDLVYCSISKQLVYDVQRLLLKFGVVSTIRENTPAVYKGTKKRAHILRVVGQRSFENFFYKIGPIPGKEFNLPSDDLLENGNLDRIPREVKPFLKERYRQFLERKKNEEGSTNGKYTVRSHKLDFKGPYKGYSRGKFRKFCELIDDKDLWDILNAEVFWDEVVSIEELPPEMTYGVEIEQYHNHVTDGIITHNTTMLGNNMVVKSVVVPYHKSLYVSPSHAQTRQFSNEKLKPAIEKSPFVRKYFQDSKVSTQVFEKGYTNGSFNFLRSCYRTADRARGISAPDLYLDEIQDLLISEIPVIAECTSHFPDSFQLYAGTPKTFDNPIEYFWKECTQNEWIVKCPHCNNSNFLDEHNIAPTEFYHTRKLPPGPVCKKCMKPIDVRTGRWTSFSPDKKIVGFRIPQLMVPWIVSTYDQWDKLLWKRDNYPTGQFYNEVLGLSFDSANKPITLEELVECCDAGRDFIIYPFELETLNRYRSLPLAAGVDWGEGNDGSGKTPSGKLRVASYTVLTIGYYETPDNFKVLFAKKYTGKEIDPNYIVNDIAGICKTLNVQLVGCDWGHGWGMNNQLIRILGTDRVMVYQHLAKQKQNIKWDPIGKKFQLKRNYWISELFIALKAGKVRFPRWRVFEPFSKDILSVYTEYSEYTREMKYDHRSSDPDDFMHSLIYCKLAGDTLIGRRMW